MRKIILASGSIQRKQLLKRTRLPFRSVVPRIDESLFDIEISDELVREIACAKALDVRSRLRSRNGRWVFGLDTVIDLNGRVIGKPKSREEAESILHSLSGREHRVVTGIALCHGVEAEPESSSCMSRVRFRDLTPEDIGLYLLTGEWREAAGGYRIQQRGEFLVESIEGSYSNIVGLPLGLFYGMLRAFNYPFPGRL